MSQVLENRYEFVYLFDVENGNPNGDPDAGNMPRLDPETNHGLVTDVCLKRKVRNYVQLAKEEAAGFKIYVKEKALLNQLHELAYVNNPDIERPDKKKLPKKQEEAQKITRWMCDNFYDIRTFGAVMSTEINAGQVRGPVQFNFSRSVEPILPMEISITRMAVTNEADLQKERTMGRKHIVPYALYRGEGYVSAPLAQQTGFGPDDLELLWEALCNMFEHDRSAARGKMSARRLYVFKHDSRLGSAPAQKLFDLVRVARKDAEAKAPARSFGDYQVSVDRAGLPQGVTVEEML
ncbi:CRISPR-associated protein, Csd2 family [Desulfarculus baarsii DSM 2075]|uniref:CRISPR-associated protein, Csd2 family n=1 Tax=Desulfarculus baarsii (strain ATCC 33931 / DSM 2075 / LMG 7858 / VKM B-1802 / 2st14) TaxID=644282 RepID=E1QHI5_DESB2|nr:type I-C CRISPR-associated protein Cas7/Csd2 [Desulfarculus baarsii]ADK85028.1 CRISPR-associated protein, Csd2 family [Desulfarculus baarsii DSM 2075]